ncbi:MAG: uncharacterized protein C75L2_00780033 [Leptospirillum sp. Group II 'C75']|jgi:hypothetical protein|uniref:DUF3501 family protein n=1 Tax=Leptospirillum sp. Group II 'CF-1' TaxID=1660083 RepID=UPI0000F0CC63|nr:DUF3501 family protein [Leptospirillum sp. Group II 'CF-1']AKS22982.1 hypothetical protein ABH19_03255 [Leptospirillum sp. Group II 'CF-1']EAY57518.1 MAG: conserved protein of unknown function [Leptospirillum rubarum]EIJ75833.1 MAG: uncharacterized protein C75L2_00780033 [Leptospirillum sp. Group II 'C75']
MREIRVTDLLDNTTYEQRRGDFRSRIIALKKDRGMNLGPILRLVFENRDTLLFQIQEMLLVERTTDPEKRAEEVEIYRTMLPTRSALSATLMIEITEEGRIRETLDTLQGLDRGPYLHLAFGGERVTAQFEPDRSTDEKLSSVHYLTFPFTEKQRSGFLGLPEGERVMLLSDHPRYSAMTILSPGAIRSLQGDLSDE